MSAGHSIPGLSLIFKESLGTLEFIALVVVVATVIIVSLTQTKVMWGENASIRLACGQVSGHFHD